MVKMNALDRAIAWASPARGAARAQARARMAALNTATMLYDGATRGRRADGWRVVPTDANAEHRGSAARLRDVARDMERNVPHASKGIGVISTNTVGKGIIPTIAVGTGQGSEKARAALEDLIKAHFETTACDADGRNNLYGLQRLAMRTIIRDGEVLIRRRLRRAKNKLPLPFQIQILECDYLNTVVNGPQKNGNIAIDGIEFNELGQRVAYHLFDKHPGSIFGYTSVSSLMLPKSSRIPAELIAHVYRVDRAGQARGITWFAPVILRMRDRADFADAQLIRQKIAACFAAFIKIEQDTLSTTDPDTPKGYPGERVEPGMIERLKPGEDVTFGTPPTVSGTDEFLKTVDHEVAAGLGVSYEAFTGDLAGVNFSSGRMGWIEFQRNVDDWRELMLAPQMLEPFGAWFLEAAELMIGRTPGARVEWTAPRREMINPAEEIKSARDAIRSGLSSRPYEQKRLGFDPVELDQEIADSNTRADKLKLVLDSDPRKVTQQGIEQASEAPPEPAPAAKPKADAEVIIAAVADAVRAAPAPIINVHHHPEAKRGERVIVEEYASDGSISRFRKEPIEDAA